MSNEAQQSIRELYDALSVDQSLPFIPKDLVDFEIRPGMIRVLPKFSGLSGEDPFLHLKEFHSVCSSMRPSTVTIEQIMLRTFPFSLEGLAKEWLYLIPADLVAEWKDLHKLFIAKFFPASRFGASRKAICGVKQGSDERISEYWERFKKLVSACPQHQIPDHLLIQYFYEGTTLVDRGMIDAASGGAFVDKTPSQAYELIENMAQNAQQFGIRGRRAEKVCALVESENLQLKVENLIREVKGMCDKQEQSEFAYNLYEELKMVPLKDTRVVIQLTDRSCTVPEGVIEDVLVKVGTLIFPADFYLLRMDDTTSNYSAPILLGRPFLKTAKALIDVDNGRLTLTFGEEKVSFSIYDAMKKATRT